VPVDAVTRSPPNQKSTTTRSDDLPRRVEPPSGPPQSGWVQYQDRLHIFFEFFARLNYQDCQTVPFAVLIPAIALRVPQRDCLKIARRFNAGNGSAGRHVPQGRMKRINSAVPAGRDAFSSMNPA